MHTSSVTYSRLTFAAVSHPEELLRLVSLLGLEETDEPNQWDLIQEEGSTLTVIDVVNTFFDAFLIDETSHFDESSFEERLEQIHLRGKNNGYIAHTRVFNENYLSLDNGLEINPVELFDLISSIQDGYVLEHITTQWAMSSNKCQPGAHAGGSLITTDAFTLPVVMDCMQMETIARTFALHGPKKGGTYYVNKFITPLMDMHAIKSPELHTAVQRALLQELFNEMEMSDIKELLDTCNILK